MISRRALLAGASVLPLAGCGVAQQLGAEDFSCRTPDELTPFGTLAGAPLSYEVSGQRQTFRADPQFIELLEDWAADWADLAGLGPITGISTYGAYVDKCDSWHAAGRAFDFAVVRHEEGEVSCRHDVWGDDADRLRSYWRLAASLASRFTYTLTLSYNEQHANHIHVDNSVNGYGATAFREGSRTQVQVVQGVARHVFGLDCPESGTYDDQTRQAVRQVQSRLGINRPLSDPAGWNGFLRGSAAS